jgi:hypothetical protein
VVLLQQSLTLFVSPMLVDSFPIVKRYRHRLPIPA